MTKPDGDVIGSFDITKCDTWTIVYSASCIYLWGDGYIPEIPWKWTF